LKRTSLLFALLILLYLTPTRQAEGDSAVSLEGFVMDSHGEPVGDADIYLWGFYREGTTSTDDMGHYTIEASVDETSCTLYAFYDDPDTPGIDLMPASVAISTTEDVQRIINFTLLPAATVRVEGQIRPIKSTSSISKYAFEVVDPETGAVQRIDDYTLVYGTGMNVQGYFLDLDSRTIIVPAGMEFSVAVSSSYQYERRRGRRRYYFWGWSRVTVDAMDRFEMSEGDGFTLSEGEVLELDVRKYALTADLAVLEGLRGEVEVNITGVEEKGFFTSSERHDFARAADLMETGSIYLAEENYDASYVDLRQAYLKLTGIKGRLESVVLEAEVSTKLLIVFIALASLAMSPLFTSSMLVRGVLSIVIYVPSLVYLFLIYPGSKAIPLESFVTVSVASMVGAFILERVLTFFAKQTDGGRGLSGLAALSAVFSMARHNLRRRRLRTALTFGTLLTLTMCFVALTSFSTGYGLVYNRVDRGGVAVTGVLVRQPEFKAQTPYEEGWFYPVIHNVIDWAASVDGVEGVAVKARNTPTLRPYANLGDWPIFGILGLEPEKDPWMEAIDDAIVAGDVLREDGTCLLSESLLRYDEVDIGDEISIRGVRLRVVGFFDTSVRAIDDLDGEPILPEYQVNLTPGAEVPIIESRTCQPTMVVITTVDTALEIPRVLLSRVDVLLGEDVEPTLIGKGMALTREYRFWVSSDEGVYLAYMGSQMGGKGLPLFVPWFIVVLNVVATMVNSMHERRREISILSSVGLNPAHLTGIFMAEASILGVVAGGFGYLLGLGWYPLMARFELAPVVTQKVSALWCLASIGVSAASVALGAMLAIRGSVVLTPSLRRRWAMDGTARPADGVWELPMPLKVEEERIGEFEGFLVDSLKRHTGQYSDPRLMGIRTEGEAADGGLVVRFSFSEGQSSIGGIWTTNRLRVFREPGDGVYSLSLSSKGEENAVHSTASFIRRLLILWSTESRD